MAPLIAFAVNALWGSASLAAPLSPEEAISHIGEIATVCGIVAFAEFEADTQRQPTLLDLGKPAPNEIFTAVIYGMDRAKFGHPRDGATREAHLRRRINHLLPRQAGNRSDRSQPVDAVTPVICRNDGTAV
jgi:hypothetical protein